MDGTVTLLPHPATMQNFSSVWGVGKFNIYFRNTLIVASIAMVFIVLFSVLNGYALARFRFKGKSTFMLMMLGTQMLPILMILIPLFVIYRRLGLINSMQSQILTYMIIFLPFNTLLMKGFIGNIPQQVDLAAMIDGAGRFRVIFSVILPVIIPGVVAIAAFAFISSWNDFFIAYAFINKQNLFTINIGLKFLISEYSVKYGSIAAGSIIALCLRCCCFAMYSATWSRTRSRCGKGIRKWDRWE